VYYCVVAGLGTQTQDGSHWAWWAELAAEVSIPASETWRHQ